MNYQLHYDNLIKTRKTRIPIPGIYYEKHHIIMKSMGGTNKQGNLVFLTAREHFLAHWLLWRIYRNRKAAFAFFAFSMMCKNEIYNKRKIVSSRGYAEMREAMSNRCKGIGNPMYGKTHSIETKNKLSISANYPRTIDHGNKISASNKGRIAWNKGKTVEFKESVCPHCLKRGKGNMARYHFDKCKYKK